MISGPGPGLAYTKTGQLGPDLLLGLTGLPRGRRESQYLPRPPLALLIPGKPVAHIYGLLSVKYGLLWSIVASFFGLLGVPGA